MNEKIIKVLLVEDDEDDYLIIQDLLDEIQDSTYKLDWAKSYADALEVISQESFDVYLVDYRLGKRTGLDLLEALNGERIGMPVILLTGISDRQIDMAAMQSGAADFLIKGQFDDNMLERAIRYAMERTRLINAINELAIRDELTGLYNRREMNRLLDEDVDRFNRYGRPVSLVMLDIDRFKRVNDTYGHPVGDQVLVQLSRIIRDTVRTVDRSIRYGGEEFAIILPETHEAEANKVAERLRVNVAENAFDCELEDGTHKQISVTISLGLAEIPQDVVTQKALLVAADQALYAAKQGGRNQTVLYRSIDQKTRPTP